MQAFDFGDELVTSSTASDANGLDSALLGFANFGGTAVYDGAFVFEFAQGDTIATDGSELYVGNAHAGDDGSDRENTIHRGSGTADVVAAAANEASQRDPTQRAGMTGLISGRSQSELPVSDNSSEPAKRATDLPGDNSNHGQSQKTPHRVSDNSSGAAKGHAKHEASGDGLNHGQSQKACMSPTTAPELPRGTPSMRPGDGLNHGQSQKACISPTTAGAAKGHAKHETAGEDSEIADRRTAICRLSKMAPRPASNTHTIHR